MGSKHVTIVALAVSGIVLVIVGSLSVYGAVTSFGKSKDTEVETGGHAAGGSTPPLKQDSSDFSKSEGTTSGGANGNEDNGGGNDREIAENGSTPPRKQDSSDSLKSVGTTSGGANGNEDNGGGNDREIAENGSVPPHHQDVNQVHADSVNSDINASNSHSNTDNSTQINVKASTTNASNLPPEKGDNPVGSSSSERSMTDTPIKGNLPNGTSQGNDPDNDGGTGTTNLEQTSLHEKNKVVHAWESKGAPELFQTMEALYDAAENCRTKPTETAQSDILMSLQQRDNQFVPNSFQELSSTSDEFFEALSQEHDKVNAENCSPDADSIGKSLVQSNIAVEGPRPEPSDDEYQLLYHLERICEAPMSNHLVELLNLAKDFYNECKLSEEDKKAQGSVQMSREDTPNQSSTSGSIMVPAILQKSSQVLVGGTDPMNFFRYALIRLRITDIGSQSEHSPVYDVILICDKPLSLWRLGDDRLVNLSGHINASCKLITKISNGASEDRKRKDKCLKRGLQLLEVLLYRLGNDVSDSSVIFTRSVETKKSVPSNSKTGEQTSAILNFKSLQIPDLKSIPDALEGISILISIIQALRKEGDPANTGKRNN